MAVVPLDVTTEESPARPAHPASLALFTPPPPAPRRRLRAALLLPVVGALLALPLLAAAHQTRSAPYGDHLTRYARAAVDPAGPEPLLRTRGGAVEAYDGTAVHWRHTRDGRRPLAVLAAPGQALALWSDGLVTDTERAGAQGVRWHRALPDAAPWLRTPGRAAARESSSRWTPRPG
ncbi:hypothetical protein V2W30_09120 [Streptomyces sp. Q6]|uniref:Uncharacterized protein n=1 Tax=Streptomyces citrinus TaxID=3118173 RepID=A0ACD5A8D0_9ACTN